MRVVVACLLGAALLGVAGAASAGRATGSGATASRCAQAADWQRLSNTIHAAVYCPGWMPDPLVPQIGGHWNNINSVDPDRSYLESFAWQEAAGLNTQEIHVNLRGYPGNTRIPTCEDVSTVNGTTFRKKIPCFQEPHGIWHSATGLSATMYTVNHGADSWHVLFAWHRGGSLYSISEHIAPPLSYAKVVTNLRRMIDALVLVTPR